MYISLGQRSDRPRGSLLPSSTFTPLNAPIDPIVSCSPPLLLALSLPVRLPEEQFSVAPHHDDEQKEEEEVEEEEEEEGKREGAYEAQAQDSTKGRRQQQRRPGAGAASAAAVPSIAEAAAATATGGPAEPSSTAAASSRYPWANGEGDNDAAGGGGRPEGVPTKEEALALPDGDYLSGCRVMIVGFPAEAVLPLSLLVRKGCGIRLVAVGEGGSRSFLRNHALSCFDKIEHFQNISGC